MIWKTRSEAANWPAAAIRNTETQALLSDPAAVGRTPSYVVPATGLTVSGLTKSSIGNANGEDHPSTSPSLGRRPFVVYETGTGPTGCEDSLPTTGEACDKLGTFMGVFVPVVNSIVGVILFLRLGFIVGQTGVLGALGMFTWANVGVLLTVLSTAAIVTNGVVRGGGVYFILSRTLGRDFGGAIGLIFYLANVFAAAFYVVGFNEALLGSALKQTPTTQNPEPGIDLGGGFYLRAYGWWPFLYSIVTLAVATFVAFVGSKIFAKTSTLIFLVVIASVVSIMTSLVIRGPFETLLPSAEYPDESESVRFSGLSLSTFKENLLWNFVPDEHGKMMTFQTMFAIFYPACTGTQSGASLSGDLRRASRSIPRGTLLALVTCFLAYAFLITLVGATTFRPTLIANYSFLAVTTVVPHLVMIGLMASTLSSTLTSVLGASKILQALAKDNVLGPLRPIARGYGQNQEPVLCVALTAVLVALLLLLGELNAIAPFVTLFFLMADAGMNLACLLLLVSSTPNFRPTWKYFNKATCTIGLVITTISMLYVNATYAGLTLLLIILLAMYVRITGPSEYCLREADVYERPRPDAEEGNDWGVVSEALMYHQVRKYLLRLDREGEIHIKHWRPQILLLLAPRRAVGSGHWLPFALMGPQDQTGSINPKSDHSNRASPLASASASTASLKPAASQLLLPLKAPLLAFWSGSTRPFWFRAAYSQFAKSQVASGNGEARVQVPDASDPANDQDTDDPSSDGSDLDTWGVESRICGIRRIASQPTRPLKPALPYLPTAAHIPIIQFVNNIKKSGLFMIGQTIRPNRPAESCPPIQEESSHASSSTSQARGNQDFTDHIFQARLQVHQKWVSFVRDLGVKAFVETNIASGFREGCLGLVSSCGLGVMKPNIVLMEWPPENALPRFTGRHSPAPSSAASPLLLPSPVASHAAAPPLTAQTPFLGSAAKPLIGSHRTSPGLSPMFLPEPAQPSSSGLPGVGPVGLTDSQDLDPEHRLLIYDYIATLNYTLRLGKNVGLARGFTSPTLLNNMSRFKSPMSMFLHADVGQGEDPKGSLSGIPGSVGLLAADDTPSVSLLNICESTGESSASKRFIDVWPLLNIVFASDRTQSEKASNPDDEIIHGEVAHILSLQLGYILHNVQEWKRSTTLRITRLVSTKAQVEAARPRFKAYLKSLRIRASLRVVSIETLLDNFRAKYPQPESPGDRDEKSGRGRQQHHSVASADSWSDLSYEQKMAIVNESFRQYSGPQNGTVVIMTNLPPPPAGSTGLLHSHTEGSLNSDAVSTASGRGKAKTLRTQPVRTSAGPSASGRAQQQAKALEYWDTLDTLSCGLSVPIVMSHGTNWVMS